MGHLIAGLASRIMHALFCILCYLMLHLHIWVLHQLIVFAGYFPFLQQYPHR